MKKKKAIALCMVLLMIMLISGVVLMGVEMINLERHFLHHRMVMITKNSQVIYQINMIKNQIKVSNEMSCFIDQDQAIGSEIKTQSFWQGHTVCHIDFLPGTLFVLQRVNDDLVRMIVKLKGHYSLGGSGNSISILRPVFSFLLALPS